MTPIATVKTVFTVSSSPGISVQQHVSSDFISVTSTSQPSILQVDPVEADSHQ